LFKISALIEHYFEHKDSNSELTLLQFFMMHYAVNNTAHDDYEKDKQLPFKSCHHHSVTADLITTVKLLNFSFGITPCCHNQQSFHEKASMFKGSLFLASIWQPPKFC
jgi:hypothetical protein